MAAEQCIDTILFGQVCDKCDGGAILKVVSEVFKFMSASVLLLAVIGVIICGVMIMTARDNPAQVAKGRKRLIDVIIGLVVYAFMFVIANFLIPGGIMNSTLDSSTSSCPAGPAPAAPADPGNNDGGEKPKGNACYYDYGDTAKTALVYLMNSGYTPEAATAIVGVMSVESRLRPNVLEGGELVTDNSWTVTRWDRVRTGPGGFGLMQWTDRDEHNNLQSFADKLGKPVISLEVQLKFLVRDLACSKEAGCDRNDPNSIHKQQNAYAYFDPAYLNKYASRSIEEAVFWLARRYTIPSVICNDVDGDGVCIRGGRTFVHVPRSYPAGAQAIKKNGGIGYMTGWKKYEALAKQYASLVNTSCTNE